MYPSGDPSPVDEGARARRGQSGHAIVPIECLQGAYSPRLSGVDEEHAKILAQGEDALPAILVQRTTMRVIDGMHRLRAAQLRRQTSIKVRYLEVDDRTAFLRGVAENIKHGLPLTLADRKAAATRVIELYPEWSDRAVASATGLSHKTVGAIRQTCPRAVRLSHRVGQDGRVRPINSTVHRRSAGELLAQRPDTPVREIAAAAGLSETTVRDMRNRMRRGQLPIPAPRTRSRHTADSGAACDDPDGIHSDNAHVDIATVLDGLGKDPALQYSATGRLLLRWFRTHFPVAPPDEFVQALPTHCLPVLARLTRRYALFWVRLAETIEKRAHDAHH
jgi:hypothetical protein